MNTNSLFLYKFWVQVVISLSVLTFCGVGLSSSIRRNENLYSNLAFLIIGYWLPSPGGQNKKEENQISIESEQTNINTESKHG